MKRLFLALCLFLLPLPALAAGTIFGLPLSQQLTENGEPMSGGKLYLYDGGTSTPATAYGDFGLTTGNELSHPIVLDSSGRIPEFWLADGSYRVRLTDAAGNEIFDISSTTALGASSGTGGSGGSAVSETAIFDTGDFLWQPVNATRSGWVRANGRSIGSVSSGATERANADTEELFTFLWNNFDNTLCPVSGGRGANAAADFAANKTIGTLDMRGRLAYGLDTMGTTAASVVAGATTAGGAFGQEELAISQANLPSVTWSDTLALSSPTHTHAVGTIAAGNASADHTHSVSGTSGAGSSHSHSDGTYAVDSSAITNGTLVWRAGSGSDSSTTGTAGFIKDADQATLSLTSTDVDGTSGAEALHTHSFSDTSTGQSVTHTHSMTGTTSASSTITVDGSVTSGGSGTAFDTLPPGRAGSWYLKL